MNEHRQRVVEIARHEIECGDPTGAKYWDACDVRKPYPKHWCGAFALYCLRTAGLTDWPWVIGKGFAFRLLLTTQPEPGDVAYFRAKQHHALVCSVDGPAIVTIDGNQGPALPIRERQRKRSEAAGYYSIRSILPAQSELIG